LSARGAAGRAHKLLISQPPPQHLGGACSSALLAPLPAIIAGI